MVDDPEEVVETGGAETAEEPQEPQQTTEESTEVDGEAQAEPKADEPEIKSERGQKRVQQLANERNELKQENKTLRQVVEEEPTAVSQEEQQMPPWMQPKQEFQNLAGQELTPEQYEQHLTAKARELAAAEVQGLRQEMVFRSNLEQDINYLEKHYPELSGEIADPTLNKAIMRAKDNFKRAYKADPTTRLRDFIEPLMDVRQGAEQQGRATASAKLHEQADAQAPLTTKTTATRESSEQELMRLLDEGKISLDEAEARIAELQG